MNNFVKNELIKISKQRIFLVIIFLIVIGCIFYANSNSRLKESIKTESDGWKNELRYEKKNIINAIDEMNENSSDRRIYEIELDIIELRLNNNISDYDWRIDIMNEYKNLLYEGDDVGVEIMHKAVVENDWRLYYNYKLDESNKIINNYSSEKSISDYVEAKSIKEEAELRLSLDIYPTVYATYWKDAQLKQYLSNKNNIRYDEGYSSLYEKDYEEIEKMKIENIKILHRLYNDIETNEEISLANYLNDIVDFRLIILLLIMMITGNSICQEYTLNTLKNLYTYGGSRKKVIASKYLSMLLVSVIICVFTYITSIICGHIFYGNTIYDAVFVIGNKAFSMNYYLYMLIKYVLLILESNIIIVMTIAISMMLENVLLSAGIMSAVIYGVPKVVEYMYEYHKLDVVKYIPSINFDFAQFWDKNIMIYGMKIWYAIVIYLLCFVAANINICWCAKEDVK